MERVTAQAWSTVWFARIRARVGLLRAERDGRPVSALESQLASATLELERLRDDSAPAVWLRTHLGLSETEEYVAWVLIAAELATEIRG
jgi:hypothetical protein